MTDEARLQLWAALSRTIVSRERLAVAGGGDCVLDELPRMVVCVPVHTEICTSALS